MASNPITGDALRTRMPSKEYSDGWDAIFGKKEKCRLCGENDGRGEIKCDMSSKLGVGETCNCCESCDCGNCMA